MDCKTIEKQIPDFLSNQLEEENLSVFVKHLNECDDCKEELSFQYLLTEGLSRLEEGDAFSLDEELKEILSKANKKVRKTERINDICNTLEICFSLFVTIAILFMIF